MSSRGHFAEVQRRLGAAALLLIVLFASVLPEAFAVGDVGGEVSGESIELASVDVIHLPTSGGGGDGSANGARASGAPSATYVTTRIVPSGVGHDCAPGPGGVLDCVASENACGAVQNYQIPESNGGVPVVEPGLQGGTSEGEDMVTVERIRVHRATGNERRLGFACVARSAVGVTTADPVVITVTLEDFQRLGVDPLVAHAGPLTDWLPVNMVNVLYAESETQTIDTVLLA